MRSLITYLLLFFFPTLVRSQQMLEPQFSHPWIIRYDHNAFIIHGKDTFIFSGSFHYFRSDPREWMDILQKIKAAGFNAIETYVPWNFHERVKGKPKFSLLNKFLDDCELMKLYVIIRIGPYVCGEWDEGGFPRWLAGKGIGFRTDSPQDVYWSRYWYNELLPVIRPHLITNGGSIILLQIENEYNYFGLPDSQKVRYLKSLYHDVIENHIDVPIITCWTQQVRDKTDSVFSLIMDAGNFYPGWNFKATLPRLQLLKQQQPYSPPFITELQGGWFTAIGDKTVRHIHRFSGRQIDGLTKYMVAHGVKGFNYYMLYGGTNFGYWAGRGKTTSYDYTAPISECGGLWSKYYAVKLIGDLLKYANPYLTMCHEVPDGAVCATDGIQVILRSDGKVGFLFVFNERVESTTADVEVKMPGQKQFHIEVPVQGHSALVLPINLPLPGGALLRYSNVQLSGVTKYKGKPLIVAYGTPGEKAVITLGSKLFTEQITSQDDLYVWNGCYILLTSEDRAARGLTFDTRKGSAVLLSDSYFATTKAEKGKGKFVRLETRPGKDNFSLVADGGIKRILLDGKPTSFTKNRLDNLIQFSFNTPVFRTPQVELGQILYKTDAEAQKNSYFKQVSLGDDGMYPSLDSMGNHHDGYSIYQGKFKLSGEYIMKFSYYDDDWHSVFIDGKPLPSLTGNTFEDWSEVHLLSGTHSLKIIYENEGRPNSGFMEEKKGVKSISTLSPGQIRPLKKWRYFVQETVQGDSIPIESSFSYDDSGWKYMMLGEKSGDLVNERQIGTWYRKLITLTAEEADDNPRLVFEGVSRSANIYINGKLAYNFRHHGWNAPFTVSLKGIVKPGKNLVAVYVENPEGKGGIIRPILFEYGRVENLKLINLTYHPFLNGNLAGWQRPSYNDSGWRVFHLSKDSISNCEIYWYRTEFTVPKFKSWVVPWRVHVKSTGDMQIWLNGRLLGRYYASGPQEDFYMPEGWLKSGAKNSLVLVMRPSGNEEVTPKLENISVEPYDDYVVQRHLLRLEQ